MPRCRALSLNSRKENRPALRPSSHSVAPLRSPLSPLLVDNKSVARDDGALRTPGMPFGERKAQNMQNNDRRRSEKTITKERRDRFWKDAQKEARREQGKAGDRLGFNPSMDRACDRGSWALDPVMNGSDGRSPLNSYEFVDGAKYATGADDYEQLAHELHQEEDEMGVEIGWLDERGSLEQGFREEKPVNIFDGSTADSSSTISEELTKSYPSPPVQLTSSPDFVERGVRRLVKAGCDCFGAGRAMVKDRRKSKPRGVLTVDVAQEFQSSIDSEMDVRQSMQMPCPAAASVEWMIDDDQDQVDFQTSSELTFSSMDFCRASFEGPSWTRFDSYEEDGSEVCDSMASLGERCRKGFSLDDTSNKLSLNWEAPFSQAKQASSSPSQTSPPYPCGSIELDEVMLVHASQNQQTPSSLTVGLGAQRNILVNKILADDSGGKMHSAKIWSYQDSAGSLSESSVPDEVTQQKNPASSFHDQMFLPFKEDCDPDFYGGNRCLDERHCCQGEPWSKSLQMKSMVADGVLSSMEEVPDPMVNCSSPSHEQEENDYPSARIATTHRTDESLSLEDATKLRMIDPSVATVIEWLKFDQDMRQPDSPELRFSQGPSLIPGRGTQDRSFSSPSKSCLNLDVPWGNPRQQEGGAWIPNRAAIATGFLLVGAFVVSYAYYKRLRQSKNC